jgi:AcrR family transcriptional regulator
MRDETRDRIVAMAAELLARDGREAVTTRAVAAAAGVQAPTIYRLFGDKTGLLDAVAEHGFQTYLGGKAAPDGDPVECLRAGWDLHVGFGLAHPGLYALMYGDPRPGAASPAAERAMTMLRALVGRIAEAGRLRVAEEQAVHLVHATACGCVLTLLATAEAERDPALSGLAREAALAAVIADAPAVATPGPVGAAVALRAALADTDVVTDGERGLLSEWLDRIAAAGAR